MASTLGTLDVLCACGRMLHIPTDVVFVQAKHGDVVGKVELDRGYLYAHVAHLAPHRLPATTIRARKRACLQASISKTQEVGHCFASPG